MMINMKTMTKRVTNSRKHKKFRTRITKIKIMTTKRVINSCIKEREKKDDDQHEDHNQEGCK